MLYIFLSCLALATTNPPLLDNPKVSVDRIEINHFWQESDSTFNGKEIVLGKCVFDQIIIWKINELTLKDEVFIYKVIQNGRKRDRITDDEEKKKHIKEVDDLRLKEMIIFANKAKVSIEDVVVYTDSEYIGPPTAFYRAYYNGNTQKYEVTFKTNDIRYNDEMMYTFCAPNFVETNTLFDAELEYRKENKKGMNSYFKGFDLPKFLSDDRVIEQLHWRR